MLKFLFQIIEPFFSMLDQFGLKEPVFRWARNTWLWLAGLIVTAAIATWNFYLYVWQLIPLWAVPLALLAHIVVFAGTILVMAWFGIKVVNAWLDTKRRVTDTSKIKEWADRIEKDCQDMGEYFNSLAEVNELYKITPANMEVTEKWDYEKRLKNKVNQKFYARYQGRLLANHKLISELGINLPWHISNSVGDQPRSLIAFHSYIATLLRDGYIEQAKAIDDGEGFRLIAALTR